MKKVIAKIALVLIVGVASTIPKKRKPLVAVFKMKQQGEWWLLRGQLAKKDLNEAMRQEAFNKGAVSPLTEHEKILFYLQKNITIFAQNIQLELINADLKTDENEVDVVWRVKGMPLSFEQIRLDIQTCATIPNHQNFVYLDYNKINYHCVLSSENHFQAVLLV